MTVPNKLPSPDQVVDGQFIQIPGPDGLLIGYQYDANTRTFYQRVSQIIIPSHHGITHIAEDPIPNATCDSPGLMAPDDKCKLDSMLGMRVGVLGFQGAGMPDDGGFLQGDIILAAGSDFISIERLGNVVRFTVSYPTQLSCDCETCSSIFWVQDESDVRSIRPPSCNGIMPDVSMYGELKIYTFPKTTVIDPKDPLKTLQLKSKNPGLYFKRYNNAITPYENTWELALKKNSDGTTNVGHVHNPGQNNLATCVWFTGRDKNNGQIKYEFLSEAEPNLLGSLLYKGHLITKQMAVIVDYSSDVLNTNQYILRKWDIVNAAPVGDKFTSTNIWQYDNPENSATAATLAKKLIKDSTVNVLPVGTLVDIWEFEISRSSVKRITRSFFSKRPEISPSSLWNLSGGVQFGDLFVAREEINNPISGTDITASELQVSDVRVFEPTIWGMNSFEDRMILSDDGGAAVTSDHHAIHEPSGEPINNDVVADIDPLIPGLRIQLQTKSILGDVNGDGVVDNEDLRLFMCAYNSRVGDHRYNANADFNADGVIDIRDLAILGQNFNLDVERVPDRPVFLWHRANHKNTLIRTKVGMPESTGVGFPPYDFLLSAPVDNFDDRYVKVVRRGTFYTGPFAGQHYVIVKGVRWEDLPAEGTLRIMTGAFRNAIWRYSFKAGFSAVDDNCITLIGHNIVFPFDEDFPIVRNATDCASYCRGTVTGANGEGIVTGEAQFCDFTAGSGHTSGVDAPTNTTVAELLRQDYTAPCIRLQFCCNYATGSQAVQMQAIVGMLSMGEPYDLNTASPLDDLVRGFAPGYTVSQFYLQDGFITDGQGLSVKSTPTNYRCYVGGTLPIPVNGQTEKWNDVEIMLKDNQVWLWFNGLLIPPDTKLSAQLPTPVTVNTPYFPINPQIKLGKFAIRMFPGAILRSTEIYDQLIGFNEFTLSTGQLTVS